MPLATLQDRACLHIHLAKIKTRPKASVRDLQMPLTPVCRQACTACTCIPKEKLHGKICHGRGAFASPACVAQLPQGTRQAMLHNSSFQCSQAPKLCHSKYFSAQHSPARTPAQSRGKLIRAGNFPVQPIPVCSNLACLRGPTASPSSVLSSDLGWGKDRVFRPRYTAQPPRGVGTGPAAAASGPAHAQSARSSAPARRGHSGSRS